MIDLEQQIINLSIKTVYIASAVLLISVVLAVLLKKKKKLKLPLFLIIATAMIVPTIVMSAGTIYLNTHAESGGPVHWHADIEYWVCDTELELRDPIGRFSNKIGTSTYHEQDKTYSQRKLENPAEYLLRDESVVPPGDCVIIEFNTSKKRTDKLCQQYGVRDSSRCVEFGVKEFNPELCNIRKID